MKTYIIIILAIFVLRLINKLFFLAKNEYPRNIEVSSSIDVWGFIITFGIILYGLIAIEWIKLL
jgi:hypothetical protein